MNNLNYGYPSSNNSSFSSSFSSQYSSTPSNSIRYQRPRFAYSGPPSYPRPRSSASKPNPDSYYSSYFTDMKNSAIGANSSDSNFVADYVHGYSDSMRNNYGDSTMNSNDSLTGNSRDSFGDSFTPNSSAYYTANESFYDSLQKSMQASYQNESYTLGLSNRGGHSSFDTNDRPSTYFNSNAEQLSTTDNFRGNPATSFEPSITRPTGSYGVSTRGNRGSFRGRFQKKFASNSDKFKGSSMGPKPQYHCAVCAIDFTSQIPLEMHLRGSRHAKKLKTQSALNSILGQNTQVKEIDKPDGKKFFCEICNVIANSSLQLQMHLDGTKHKSKIQQLSEPKDDSKDDSEKKVSEVNGKGSESVVRTLPPDFGNPQPTKMTKFSCDICNTFVNSEVQLQQHLSSKKHQAKVEGKPIIKKRKAPKQDDEAQPPMEQESTESSEKTEVTNVVGVKTLSASFVQGEILQ